MSLTKNGGTSTHQEIIDAKNERLQNRYNTVDILPKLASLDSFRLRRATPESMFKATMDCLKMETATRPRSFPSPSLYRPIVLTNFGRRIPTSSASLLLNVIGLAATAPALCMGLIVAFAKGCRTLGHS